MNGKTTSLENLQRRRSWKIAGENQFFLHLKASYHPWREKHETFLKSHDSWIFSVGWISPTLSTQWARGKNGIFIELADSI